MFTRKGAYAQRERTGEIRDFVARNLQDNSSSIVDLVARKFAISRQAAHRHVHRMTLDGLIAKIGKTSGTTYAFIPLVQKQEEYTLASGLEEDLIWKEARKLFVGEIQKNVLAICGYGFTEMVNNVIDHSSAEKLIISVEQTLATINLGITDNGVGIFNKLATDLSLPDPKHAILELHKGKVTTDPEHHTGEGIFFTSRMVDRFSIFSGPLYFTHLKSGNDYLLDEKSTRQNINGTAVHLEINTFSSRRTKDIFNEYSPMTKGFSKTKVPVFLVEHGKENLVSRSQAKRLLAGLDKFQEIILDFEGIEEIGQAFADEIFRVFARNHPGVSISSVNETQAVANMIKRIRASKQPPLF